MRHLPVLAACAILAACVGAVTGEDRITALLAGRSVDYDYGWDAPMAQHEVQTWKASGETMITNASLLGQQDIFGQWKVENGVYCERFGSTVAWKCLTITFPDGGKSIRFREVKDEASELIIHLFEEDRTGRFLPG